MAEVGDLYEQLRNDISEFVAGLNPEVLETPVPATPGWGIRDVIAPDKRTARTLADSTARTHP